MQIARTNSGAAALQLVEKSMSESSQDQVQAGINPGPGQTAFQMAQVQSNAQIQLGLFGKMLGALVTDYGYLMRDVILNHITVGQVEEITAGIPRMKFRTFLLAEKVENGKKVSKKIVFTEELMGIELEEDETEEERLEKESFKVAEEQGGIESDTKIVKVNPARFRSSEFMFYIAPEAMLPSNQFLDKALKLESYDRMIGNPFVDQAAATRDFLLEPVAEGNADKYMAKEPAAPPEAGGGIPSPIAQQNGSLVEKLVNTNAVTNKTPA